MRFTHPRAGKRTRSFKALRWQRASSHFCCAAEIGLAMICNLVAGALGGILVAYLLFHLDAILLPPLLVALSAVAMNNQRLTAFLATALSALIVIALPLTSRLGHDLVAYLAPRLVAVIVATAIGTWMRGRPERETVLR